MSKGKVYLVGAGPGDVELITLKGFRLLAKADVILYDHLSSAGLLDFSAPSAELISVGKFAGKHTLPQEDINRLIVDKAKEGKIVVRLKGGDSYLFGRGSEEAEACFQGGVEFQVVPGVTSALAAPCYAGIPATDRDCTSDVAIVTGHRKAGDDKPIEIPKAGTVIFLMSVGNIKHIVNSLLDQGWPEDEMIAAVEKGTCYDQRVIKDTLGNFLKTAEKAKLRTPAIFIVGKVVQLQEKLDWFTPKPNVLVLGNHPERYTHLGNIVHRRVIDCVAIEDYSKVDLVVDKIADYDWIIFTSVNGAKHLFSRLNQKGLDTRELASLRIAAIGKTTAARLLEYGIIADVVPGNESSAGLLEEFAKIDMEGKKVLLPQAEFSTKELPEGLAGFGAEVEKLVVYRTVDIEPAEVDFDYIDAVLFTSGSTVRAFIKYFKEVPPGVKVYGLGEPTLAVAKEYNITGELMPKASDDQEKKI
ncbi:MAG: uroporphyrinogen-III C-methyltransferase [Sedimentisphaerales bacterium]|nr:uroporphyrinogen-III C-methyltransferase [Sedimentisphaerales bacterium]